MNEHLYIVTYDIADPKRWRRVFNLMQGHGEWVQLSVFQCRMNRRRLAELIARLDEVIHHSQDQVILVDTGPVQNIKPHIVSLGKSFEPLDRKPTII